MKRVFSKPMRNRLISSMLSFCMTFVIGTEAFAQGNSLKQGKGKYYGVQLAQKDKVKTINKAASKTTKPIRKPTVKNNKPAFEFSLNANQEVKEKRELNSKTFNEGNGKQKTYVYLDKIHYKDSFGQLQDIDNNLMQQGKGSNLSYENKANDYKVAFPAQLTKDNSISITKGDSSIEITPADGDFSKSSVAKNSILYQDVFPGIDFQYDVENSAVKENIVLNNYVNQNTFKYKVSTKNVELKEEYGSIRAYKSGEKDPVFIINAPAMIDASGKISQQLTLHLNKNLFTKDEIELTADKNWLEAKDRAYPVTIDPDISVPDSSIHTATAEQSFPNLNTMDNGYLYVGNDDGKATGNLGIYGYGLGHTKTYIKFPFTADSSTIITSAKLILDRYRAYGSTTRAVALYNINDNSFNINSVTWNHQPASKTYYTSATVC